MSAHAHEGTALASAGRSGEPAGPPGTLVGASVVTGDGLLELVEVQPEGRKRVAAGEWLRGVRLQPEERLGP